VRVLAVNVPAGATAGCHMHAEPARRRTPPRAAQHRAERTVVVEIDWRQAVSLGERLGGLAAALRAAGALNR